MSMLDGVSQCWLLSSTCGVNWNAWAAVATAAAAGVALWMGMTPLRLRQRQAKFAVRVLLPGLDDQVFYLMVCQELLKDEEYPVGCFNIVRAHMLTLETDRYRDAIQFFDVLPSKLAEGLADVIAHGHTVTKLFRALAFQGPGDERSGGLPEFLGTFIAHCEGCHREMSTLLGDQEAFNATQVPRLVDALKGMARRSELAGWNEEKLHQKLFGSSSLAR